MIQTLANWGLELFSQQLTAVVLNWFSVSNDGQDYQINPKIFIRAASEYIDCSSWHRLSNLIKGGENVFFHLCKPRVPGARGGCVENVLRVREKKQKTNNVEHVDLKVGICTCLNVEKVTGNVNKWAISLKRRPCSIRVPIYTVNRHYCVITVRQALGI